MNATLFTFDAAQWGGFAFAAFIAALAYCTAYLMRMQRFSLGSVEMGGEESGRFRRWLLPITALVALAAFSLSLSVYVALQLASQSPSPVDVENRYFTEVSHRFARDLQSQTVVAAKARVTNYDGFSHARVFVNHSRVFESSVHCRFHYQCKPSTAGKAPTATPVVCLPFRCRTNKDVAVVLYRPMLLKAEVVAQAASHAQACSNAAAMQGVRSCGACVWEKGCSEGRRVNWQSGIETASHDLPFEIDLMKLLRPGENIVEVSAENSGIGLCAFRVELLIQTADGKNHPHAFVVDGPLKAKTEDLGPRYGVEPTRAPFTTCDRQRMKFRLKE